MGIDKTTNMLGKIVRSAETNFGYLCLCVMCMLCMTMIALQAALGFIFAACSFIKFKIRLEKPA